MNVTNQQDVLDNLFNVIDKLYETINTLATISIIGSECDFDNYDHEIMQNYLSLQLGYIHNAKEQSESMYGLFQILKNVEK